jgi:serine/threonine protein phosphatase 1
MTRTYAIGDVHGCYDEMMVLLSAIRKDAKDMDRVKLVFTGDYVDRGPKSKQVIDQIMVMQDSDPLFDVIALRGNHEDMMVEYEDEWLYANRGGVATCDSYGRNRREVYSVRKLVGENHYNWLEKLPYFHRAGKCFFVHAGLNPRRELVKQTVSDMVWGRHNWNGAMPGGVTVIHGHTPTHSDHVDIIPHAHRPTRVNIDTGCIFGGRLSAIRIDEVENPSIVKTISTKNTSRIKGYMLSDELC